MKIQFISIISSLFLVYSFCQTTTKKETKQLFLECEQKCLDIRTPTVDADQDQKMANFLKCYNNTDTGYHSKTPINTQQYHAECGKFWSLVKNTGEQESNKVYLSVLQSCNNGCMTGNKVKDGTAMEKYFYCQTQCETYFYIKEKQNVRDFFNCANYCDYKVYQPEFKKQTTVKQGSIQTLVDSYVKCMQDTKSTDAACINNQRITIKDLDAFTQNQNQDRTTCSNNCKTSTKYSDEIFFTQVNTCYDNCWTSLVNKKFEANKYE